MTFVPDLEGHTSDPGGFTPPSSGSGGGSNIPPINLANLPVTGGLVGVSPALLIAGQDVVTGFAMFYRLDTTNFNCEEDVVYDFKIEEVEIGNKLTIHNILVRYRDIGVVTFSIGIINYLNQNFTTQNSRTVTVGNKKPTFRIFTQKMNIPAVTIEAPQIRILRKAKAGPLTITKVKAWGSYGDGDII